MMKLGGISFWSLLWKIDRGLMGNLGRSMLISVEVFMQLGGNS
jgi:hypothetical protein